MLDFSRALQLFDEYNDFYQIPRKRVIVSIEEDAKPASAHKRHTARAAGGRRSVTGGVCFGPLHKGVAMLMVEQAAEETRLLISNDFKGNLVLIVNKTGSCYGSSHVNDVIPRVMARSAERCRRQLCLADGEFVANGQDRARGHYYDRCSVTGEVGLNSRRYELYQKHKLCNFLLSLHGTPEQMTNDHIHQILKVRVHAKMREFTAGWKDHTLLPDREPRARGGPFVSKKGYRRGPHLYLLALCLSKVWAEFEQELLFATFVKLGYFSIEQARGLNGITEGFLRKGIQLLEAETGAVSSLLKHPAHDPSGQREETRYVCKNNFGSLPTRGDESLAQRAAEQVKSDEELKEQYAAMKAKVFTEVKALKLPDVDKATLLRSRSWARTMPVARGHLTILSPGQMRRTLQF